jgi:hypothetical protein
MPFLAEEHIDVPNNDLLSWMFDDQTYDKDAPVRSEKGRKSMRTSLMVVDLRRCRGPGTHHHIASGPKHHEQIMCRLQVDRTHEK